MSWPCVYNATSYLAGASGGVDSTVTGVNGSFADQMTALNAATVAGDLVSLAISYTGDVPFGVQSGWDTAVEANVGNTTDTDAGAIKSVAIFTTVKGGSPIPDLNFPRTGGSSFDANLAAHRPTASGTITLGPTSSNTLATPSTTATTGSLTTVADSLILVALGCRASPPTSNNFLATDPGTFVSRLNVTTSADDIWQSRKRAITGSVSPPIRLMTGDASKTGAGATGTITAAGNASTANLHTLVAASFYIDTGGGGPDPIEGNQSATLTLPSQSAAGLVSIAGAAALTLAMLTGSGTGTVAVAGASASTLPAITAAGAGSVAVSGDSSVTLEGLSQAAAGGSAVAGASSVTLPGLSGSGAGSVAVAGASSATLAAVTPSASGALAIQGAASQTLEPVVQSATGSGVDVNVGESSVTLALPVQTGGGTVAIAASASQALLPVTHNGAGQVAIVGVSTVTLQPLTYSASASIQIAGEAAQTLPAIAGTAAASVAIAGAQDALLGLPVQVATGTAQDANYDTPPERSFASIQQVRRFASDPQSRRFP